MERKKRCQIGDILKNKNLLSKSLTSFTDCSFKRIASRQCGVDANGPDSTKLSGALVYSVLKKGNYFEIAVCV